MGEIGQVVEVKDAVVKVRLNRKEACAKCGACTAGIESKDMFIEATNNALAHKGDFVEITLKEENFIKAVAIMYGIPLIGLLVGLGLGAGLGAAFMPGLADVLAIVLGLLGAGHSFLLIHLNENRFKVDEYKPKAVKVVDSYNDSCDI